ncbi:MAG: hypothetical protein IJ079_03840 [Lachnospiraceae bacterium]|nr:hypothetical protein [Lachnospiraceae bacterium]MBR1567540.1 hypothetical protein [Lachnospiraceae bacterium]MBR1568696.1 hypothetical protein [Lachnospiraceae bacterium]
MVTKNRKINILGTVYDLEYKLHTSEDLENCSGYADYTKKMIAVRKTYPDDYSGDVDYVIRETLRHEILHAFLYESGLGDNWEHKSMGHEETLIDWFAIQYPKLRKIYQELECED